MASKISETLSLAGGNLARPTKFSALIAPPAEILGATNSKVFDVLCKNIKVPDITMEPIDITYKGHNLKLPSRVNQEQTIELTMYLDEHHTLRQMFHDWITGIDNRFYAVSTGQAANLQRSKNIFGNLIIKVRDFDETTNEPMNYLIEGVYPISVSGPEFGSAAVSEISEFNVTLAYYRFLSHETNGNYDDIDSALDIIGPSAANLAPSSFGTFGQFTDIVSNGSKAINSIGSAFNSIGNIF